MSFWSSQQLEQRLPALVDCFQKERIDCNAYTLRIGAEMYVSPSDQSDDPSAQTIRQLSKEEAFTIPPGQFAYLITQEAVEIPVDAMAFISIKAKMKFRGLVNVSGFHVDPGYKGNLIFSVYNAGPSVIHLRQGQSCFLIWFADLDRPCAKHKVGVHNGSIEAGLINAAPGELQSLEGLSVKIKEAEKRLVERMNAIESKQASLDARTAAALALASALLVGSLVVLARSITLFLF